MYSQLWVKVLVWRVVSVILTLITTWLYTGDISKASGLTAVLHAVLIVSHYVFETFWTHKMSQEHNNPE